MEWVSGWIQGIIIAVIISTIIEMILPEGTSKKYIKVVIGIYILFSMVSPVISKVTKSEFRVSDIFDLDEYIEASKNSGDLQNKIEGQNQDQIKEIYLTSMKNDIREKIENKGYIVNSVNIKVENDEQYTLQEIKLQIEKEIITHNDEEKKETNKEDTKMLSSEKVENVEEVKIQVGSDSQNSSNSNSNTTSNKSENNKRAITIQEKRELKNYLSSVYEINIKNIFINE